MQAQLTGNGKTGKQRMKFVTKFPSGITRPAVTTVLTDKKCGCQWSFYYNCYVHQCVTHRTCKSTHGRVRTDLVSAQKVGR